MLGQSSFRTGRVEGEFKRQDGAGLEMPGESDGGCPSSPRPGTAQLGTTQLSLSRVSLEPPKLLTLCGSPG